MVLEKAIARLPGMVQGVVVQMTAKASFGSPFTTLNFTKIVGESFSWYSTSASARAVFSTTDHMTGFEPR